MDLSPFLLSMFPGEYKIVPPYPELANEWVNGNSTLFNTQWIDCSYPISGSYGATPRYIFYALVLVSLAWRRLSWISGAAMGVVIVYSSTAAVHAIALNAIKTSLLPKFINNNYEVVLAGGGTQTGFKDTDPRPDWNHFDEATKIWATRGLWLPLVPSVWDADGDAVLAIVGVAFLALAPMQAFSRTFRDSTAKTTLLLWSILLSLGMLFALINEWYITMYSFPQLRFCPLNTNDTLPITNGGRGLMADSWDHQDWYRWNRTITNYFNNLTDKAPTACLYPCFDTSWSLRDPTEIIADVGSPLVNFVNGLYLSFVPAIYFIVSSSALASLGSFFASLLNDQPHEQGADKVIGSDDNSNLEFSEVSYLHKLGHWFRKHVLYTHPLRWTSHRRWVRWSMRVFEIYMTLANFWAVVLSPVALILFTTWIELTITADQPGETFRHIGQWGALIGAVFVMFASGFEHYFGESIAAFKLSKLTSYFKSHKPSTMAKVEDTLRSRR